MRKRIRNSILAVLCTLATSAICIGGGIMKSQNVEAENNVVLTETVALEDAYALGTKLQIPASTVTVDGTPYAAETILRYPDGSVFGGSSLTLNVAGKYTLEYRAETPFGVKSVKKEFQVFETVYSVGSKSTAVYGSVDNAPDQAGIVASLAQGDRLTYNRVINLNENTKDDTIVKLFVNPKTQGLADALNVVFVLTDAHDSENFVTVTAKRLDREPLTAGWQERNAYVTTNAVGQPAIGLEQNANGTFSWNGGTYQLHRNNIYGAGIKFSMAGVPKISDDCSNLGAPTDIGTQALSLSMDYENRRVYMNNTIVADLDDVSIYPSLQWKGFTTGECILSVYATSYNEDFFQCVVTEVDGASGETLNEKYIMDSTAPLLKMEQGAYTDGFPDAIVGRTYPIPQVVATGQTDTDVTITAKVYREASQGEQVNVTLKNGVFVPKYAGKYTVVYTAKDYAGNVSTLSYEVVAKPCADELSIELSGGESQGETGKLVTVPVGNILNPQGIPALKIAAKLKGANVTETIATTGENAYTFRPLYEGEWDIEYVYSDYLETKTETFAVTVVKSDTPYIQKEVLLPKYAIKGATYRLPALYGYSFTTGQPIEQLCDVYLQDDKGAERKLSGTGFTSYASETATIIYRLGSGEAVAEKRYEIPVIDVGYADGSLRIADYFVGENFTKDAQNDRILIQTQATGTQSFAFINPIQTFDFRTIFHVSTATNKFQAVHIYLQDSENRDIEVKVTYRRNTAGNTLFSVNDGATTYQATADFIQSNAENFRLLYDDETHKISPSTAFGVPIEKDLNGNDFVGFPSNKVYMRVELSEITGKAGVEFISINNQPMSMVAYDLLAPEITANVIKGKKKLGEEIVIKATYAADVLDPDLDFKMYVKTPSKKYATSKDGVLLDESASPTRDYTITAEEYGSYEVYYEAVDTNGERTIYSYVFTVVDTTPPTLTLSGKVTTAKQGETVVIAKATALDDLTECTVFAMVMCPDGTTLNLPGNSFVATYKGEYTVYYFAYDKTFNLTAESYVITVS